MKKIANTFLLLSAFSFAFVACQKEIDKVIDQPQNDNTLVVSLTADIESSDADTKTSISGTTPSWTVGDKVTVVYTNSSDAVVTAESTGLASAASPATFSVTLTDPKTAVSAYAYYPSNDKSATSSTATLVIPSTQEPTTGTSFDGAADILISEGFTPASSVNAGFRRLGAVLKVHVSHASIASEKILNLSVQGPNALAGDVAVRLSDGVATGISNGSNKVTADYGEGVFTAGAADKYVYLIVYPQTLTSGSTLTISGETDNYSFSKSVDLSKDLVLKPGHIQPINVTLASVTLKDKVFFEERFSEAAGTMGWSGTGIASGTFKADNTWTTSNQYGAGGAARFGTGSKQGEATTSSISISPALYQTQAIKLSFKAGAWDYKDENTDLTISSSNCTLKSSGSAVTKVEMKKGDWTEYTLDVTSISGAITITFQGKTTDNSRFFLDDVCVYYGTKPVEKLSPGLAFSASTASAYLGETASFTEPTLTNTHSLDITYASDDEDVATVAADGQVTLVGAGTANISATFAGDATYKSQTVSYELTVSTPTITVEPAGGITMGGSNGDKTTITITATHAWTATLNAAASTARGAAYKITDGSDALISGTVSGTAGVTTIKFVALGDGDPDEVTSFGTITFTDNLYAATNTGAINIKQAVKGGGGTDYTTLYTTSSNVTVSSDESKNVSIGGKSFDAKKANKGSSVSITIPANTTTVHLFIAAWNGEGQDVTVTGGTISNASITADSAISGSSSTYTLAGTISDYYRTITPSSSSTTSITINTASKKRIVVWGVNEE